MSKPSTEIWYQWKYFNKEFGNRLLNVQADPNEYEYSLGDHLYESVNEALTALKEFGCQNEAREDKWILTEVTYRPVEIINLYLLEQESLENYSPTEEFYRTLPVAFTGTKEQAEEFATDDDYQWRDTPNQPYDGFYYRGPDKEMGRLASSLIQLPHILPEDEE